MANKFFPRMPNLVEVLNQMWNAFAAGPYNAVPLTGGTMTGPLVNKKGLFAGPGEGGDLLGLSSALFNVYDGPAPSAQQKVLAAQFGVRGISGVAYDGAWHVYTSAGPGLSSGDHTLSLIASDATAGDSTVAALTLTGSGQAAVGGNLLVGGVLYAGPAPVAARHGAYRNVGMAGEIFWVGRSGTSQPCVAVNGSDGVGGWGTAGAVIYVAKNSTTSRSVNASGTFNASGADYAEYMLKGAPCGVIAPGEIVGIDADGRLTDRWNLAVAFAVKSTNPCMVGGDTWSAHLGPRPEGPVRLEGETDEQWEAGQDVALAAQKVFDDALESARKTVDRIAFAGQVPVNLQGATPGQFIVPVQDGDGIGGQAVDEVDITLRQYMRAIGRVIAIEDDGRARIIVKVA